jgi:hypothetical protein
MGMPSFSFNRRFRSRVSSFVFITIVLPGTRKPVGEQINAKLLATLGEALAECFAAAEQISIPDRGLAVLIVPP